MLSQAQIKMLIKLTERESATIVVALRRWLSYPAAREAERAIDDAEVKCTRTTVTAPQAQDQSVQHRQRDKAAFPPPPWFSSLRNFNSELPFNDTLGYRPSA
jgi:hypothetical protein